MVNACSSLHSVLSAAWSCVDVVNAEETEVAGARDFATCDDEQKRPSASCQLTSPETQR